MTYQPLKVTGMATGLVQERENFILPDDAYPVLQNAYVWRERILRKKGYKLLGRLQRNLTIPPASNTNSLLTGLEATATLVPGSLNIIGSGGTIWTDPAANGVLVPSVAVPNGTVNYVTGVITGPVPPNTGNFSYYPGLPVMGIRIQELQNSANDRTLFFDQKYCYEFDSTANAFREYIPGFTWNASGQPISAVDFFFSTNYWVAGTASSPFPLSKSKLFWVTNNTGYAGGTADSPRITDGSTWVDFTSPYGQIDAINFLTNWLCMLPFRGRLVTFNTWEGIDKTNSVQYSNRIRWSTIGNPFILYAAGPPSTGSWRDDIRGQGGFLDIPTSEDIVAIGFVRDNLVIYCERSTWQLRYTGRAIAPFQVERVNSELGAEGTFSAVQFDTSLVGIGDKGVVECDSYKSERIDIKIPDIVFQFQSVNSGVSRVHGIRDFVNRLAYWTFPLAAGYDVNIPNVSRLFPNQRLVFNYENDSWAFFNDSLTCIGTYQVTSNRTWLNTKLPWTQCNFTWINQPEGDPVIVAGNQQGFVEQLDALTVNDVSLYISGIVGNQATKTATVVTSPNHNMKTGFVIKITGIPATTSFSALNDGIFGIVVTDANTFQLFKYDSATGNFSNPQINPAGSYVGTGYIQIRENFNITSKKFNFLDQGQSIQMGYVDVLLQATEPTSPGAISLNVYLDYNDIDASNIAPSNQINDNNPARIPDTFFNSIIPTITSSINGKGGTKFWQRVFCATRANFLTLEYTFSNAQLAGEEQEKGVQIDAQVLWIRPAGRMTQI
jgi:hypothetical protein